MILRITVPDEIYEAYGAINPKNPRKVMEDILVKFAGVDPSRKTIIVTGDLLAEIQKLLGASLDSAAGLFGAVKERLTFQVGDVNVQLTEAQRKKLVTQAKAWNRPVDEFIAEQVRENLRSL